jgi:hypothetical protein
MTDTSRSTPLPALAAHRLRRIYRKLARRKGSGSLHNITVFVRYENVIRLLGFLGYRLE